MDTFDSSVFFFLGAPGRSPGTAPERKISFRKIFLPGRSPGNPSPWKRPGGKKRCLICKRIKLEN
eukprot:UN13444